MIENLAADVMAFTSNAFLVTGERTVLVDPGANFDVVARINDRVDQLDAVILTHTHPDHVGNVDAVTAAYDVPIWGFDPRADPVDRPIEDGERIRIGDHEYEAWHTPGHKNDHLCFYGEDVGVLFAGDLVFQNGGYGRTDLAEGDHEALVRSITAVHDRVDDALRELHCGHGPSVTEDPYMHVELALQMAKSG